MEQNHGNRTEIQVLFGHVMQT